MRDLFLILALITGVVASAADSRAATISVEYNLSGSIYGGPGPNLAQTFSGTARIHYQGVGLATLSHGPIQLVSAPHAAISNIALPGVFNLTVMAALTGAGPGSLASNGALTLMVTKQVQAGFAHCFDLSPLGCQTYVMLGASIMLPLTGGVSNTNLSLGSLAAGQPPATFTLLGRNVGGSTTISNWTFSEIAGSRTIVPEPGTGTLVVLGLLGLVIAASGQKARYCSR